MCLREKEAFRCTASGSSWLELTWPKEQAVVVALPYPSEARLGRFSAARLKKRIMQQAMPSGLRSFLQH